MGCTRRAPGGEDTEAPGDTAPTRPEWLVAEEDSPERWCLSQIF